MQQQSAHAAVSARGAAAEPTPTSTDCYKDKKKEVLVSDSPYCPVINLVISQAENSVNGVNLNV